MEKPAPIPLPPSQTTAPLEIGLFGPLSVRVGGAPLPRLRSRKGLWLLALLALRPDRDVERDWVAGTLWPDADGADARRSLRQSLHDLRLALGPDAADRLACEAPRTLRLDTDGVSLDVSAFDAAVRRADPASLAEAVRLYRGPLLEDCAEEWAQEERRKREADYLGALERLASVAASQKEWGAAAGYLRALVGLDPWREEAQRALMRALAGAGNPTGALLVYQGLRDLLRREAASEPAEETTALFRRLRDEARRGDGTRPRAARPAPESPEADAPPADALPSPLAARPLNALPALNPLPRALTGLIGREEAVREVATRLSRSPLVTLTGAGGVGKTRLALAVAGEMEGEYADGSRFVDLSALSDPAAVPAAVLAALGVPPSEASPPQAPVEALRGLLASRRLLLVLDNCEQVLAACAGLAHSLLVHCPGLLILATSRQPLGLVGEAVWRVPSLALPPAALAQSPPDPPSGPPPLSEYASVRLFAERARAADGAFALTPRNAAAVARICRRLDGIPLAIELAAARVRSLPIGEIDSRLREGFGLLSGGGRALPPRQQTLSAALRWSWDLLTPEEQGLLCRLSAFSGGWTLAAAEAVGAGDGLDEGDVLDALTSLVDQSLVTFRPPVEEKTDDEDGTGVEARYFLLETVRQFAGERLRESGRWNATRGRHRDHFLTWAEEVKPRLTGPEQSLWFQRLEVEHDNFRAALSWCEQSPAAPEAGLRLAQALWRFWFVRGHLTEGRQWLARMLACDTAAGTPPTGFRAKALNAAGNLAQIQGDYAPAHACYEESLTILRDLGDEDERASVCNNLGNMVSDQGDYVRARALYEESLEIDRRLGKPQGVANALSNLGQMAYEQGDFAGARPLWEESLALERQIGNPGGIAASLGSLGLLADEAGDTEAARAYFQECLALYREVGDLPGLARALVNLGNVACRQKDFDVAQAFYDECLILGQRLNNLPTIAHGLESVATVAQGRDQPLRAVRLLGAAQALRDAIGCPLPPTGHEKNEAQLATLRELVGEAAFTAAYAEGRTLTWEQALAE